MSNLSDKDRKAQGKSAGGSTNAPPGPRSVDPSDTPSWTQDFIMDGDRPSACLSNVILAFTESPIWSGRLAYDSCSDEVVLVESPPWSGSDWSGPRPWSDLDDILAADWLQREHRIMASPSLVLQSAQAAASQSAFHPICDYLSSLVWDGEERISTWLSVYLGVPYSPIRSIFGSRFLISAVARAFRPGCKVDTCLFLEGEQGKLKSTALLTLAGPSWFTDELPDIRDKDSAIQLRGKWIVELGEIGAIQGVPISRVKQFLARSTDRYRPPYGRRASDYPRGCVFAGTVNAEAYLHDETGARRFWPVRTKDIDIESLRADRDQLWAEATHAYRSRPCWWLDTPELVSMAEAEQAERFDYDIWHDEIERYVSGRRDTSVQEILECCLNRRVGEYDQKDQNRVARVLTHLHWEHYQPLVDGRRPHRYRPKKT